MIITRKALEFRPTVYILALLIILLGVDSYKSLPIEGSPDVQIPMLIVTAVYGGVAPEDIEQLITIPIEKEIKDVDGLKNVYSMSNESFALIAMEFQSGTNMDYTYERVSERVDRVKSDYPKDANAPIITEINSSDFPIMLVNIYDGLDLVQLKSLGEKLQDDIEALPGVLEVELTGGLEREIQIQLKPDRLEYYGLSYAQVVQRIQEEHLNIPAGYLNLNDSRYLVRLQGEYKSQDVTNMADIVVMSPGGASIKIRDIADVVDGFKDVESISRFNGKDCVTLRVKKRPGANVVKVSDAIKNLLNTYSFPEGVNHGYQQDQSKAVKTTVATLESSIITGFILVLLVLLFFLGFRNALFVALAIPISMLLTFTILRLMGVTLNMVVMFGLIVALGMLVDNSIVIVEAIFRHAGESKSMIQAAYDGTKEVAWPVITSTATTVFAFAPMLFWPGIMGEFMHFLPLMVIIALLSSLFVALIINPVVSGSFSRRGAKLFDESGEAKSLPLKVYQKVLKGAVAHPILLMIGAFIFAVRTIASVAKVNSVYEVMPEADPDRGQISSRAAVGTRVEATDKRVRILEEIAAKDNNSVAIIANAGYGSGIFSGATPTHRGVVDVEFKDFEDRDHSTFKTAEYIREQIKDLPGADYKFTVSQGGPQAQSSAIDVQFSGPDYDVLLGLVRELQDLIRDVEGVVNIDDNYDPGLPEAHLIVDREKAKELGVSTAAIGMAVRTAVNGTQAGVLRVGEDEYDITVRYQADYRTSLEDLLDVRVASTTGAQIPLRDVTQIRTAGGFGSIRHINYNRSLQVTADVHVRSASEALAEVKQIIDAKVRPNLPSGYKIRYGGMDEMQQEALDFIVRAVIIALFLVIMTLIMQFNSYVKPFIIMTSVLMSLLGVALGLVITQDRFSIMMSGMACISLAGVVVNNAIVLIDYINQLRATGMERKQAIVMAGVVRLRPVFLTTITTVLGMLPMALGIGINFRHILQGDFNNVISIGGTVAQTWSPMAKSLIFGLTFATLMTLVLVPVMYQLQEVTFETIRKLFHMAPKSDAREEIIP